MTHRYVWLNFATCRIAFSLPRDPPVLFPTTGRLTVSQPHDIIDRYHDVAFVYHGGQIPLTDSVTATGKLSFPMPHDIQVSLTDSATGKSILHTLPHTSMFDWRSATGKLTFSLSPRHRYGLFSAIGKFILALPHDYTDRYHVVSIEYHDTQVQMFQRFAFWHW